jgi:hypothetical protein
MIATRHTWSQTLRRHPPSHCLVTGGGRAEHGPWVAVRHGFLLRMRVGRALCRGQRLAARRHGVAHGTLTPPEGRSRPQVEHLLNKRGRTTWQVHRRERSPHGQGVLVSLARSLRGGPLAQRRLLACAGEQVICRYEERATGPGDQASQRARRFPLAPCIGRWRQHVPAGAVRVRGWGL